MPGVLSIRSERGALSARTPRRAGRRALRDPVWSSTLVLALAGCSVDQRTLWVTRSAPSAPDAGFPLDAGTALAHFQDSPDIVYDASGGGTGGAPAGGVDAGHPETHCARALDGTCVPTLATNATFDADASGWDTSGLGVVHWVTVDANGDKGSGSLGVKNSTVGDVDGLEDVAATQCIPVTPKTKYDYASSVYINKGQPFGSAGIGVWFYDEPGCKGPVDGAYTVSTMQLTGTWVPASGSLAPLEGVKSMSVRLTATKAFRDGPFEVLFDDVRITTFE